MVALVLGAVAFGVCASRVHHVLACLEPASRLRGGGRLGLPFSDVLHPLTVVAGGSTEGLYMGDMLVIESVVIDGEECDLGNDGLLLRLPLRLALPACTRVMMRSIAYHHEVTLSSRELVKDIEIKLLARVCSLQCTSVLFLKNLLATIMGSLPPSIQKIAITLRFPTTNHEDMAEKIKSLDWCSLAYSMHLERMEKLQYVLVNIYGTIGVIPDWTTKTWATLHDAFVRFLPYSARTFFDLSPYTLLIHASRRI